MESRHKVVGIDVGFGFTKYMWLAAGERATDLFPSLVAPEPTSELPGFDLVSTGPRSATAKITVIVGKGAKSRRFVVGKSVVSVREVRVCATDGGGAERRVLQQQFLHVCSP